MVNAEELLRFSDLSNLLSERYRALLHLNEYYASDPPGELKDIIIKFYDVKVIEAAEAILESNGFVFVKKE